MATATPRPQPSRKKGRREADSDDAAWLEGLVSSVEIGLFAFGEQLLWVNVGFERLTGYRQEQLLQMPILDLLTEPERKRHAAAITVARSGGPPLRHQEWCLRTKDGGSRWVKVSTARLRPNGESSRQVLVAAAMDISALKGAELELQREKERAQVTLEWLTEAVLRTAADGSVEYLNPAAERLLGATAEQAFGRPLLDLLDSQPTLPPGAFEGDVVLRRGGDGDRTVAASSHPVRDFDSAITGWVVVMRDVTDHRTVEQERERLARYDPVTGLINRQAFERHLVGALETVGESATRHALIVLNLDNFKLFNDSWGYPAGDRLLSQLASLFRTRLPDRCLVARLAGDEFAVLGQDVAASETSAFATGLLEEIHGFRFDWDGRQHSVTASLGLVAVGSDTRDANRCLATAVGACRVAKELGGDRLYEAHGEDSTVSERDRQAQWVPRLKRAFANDQLTLFGQEIAPLSVAGSRPQLCEVLVRLIAEDGTLISPADFIPAAERYRLIGELDRWVVRKALAMLRCGEPRARDTRYSINLSGHSLTDPAFLSFILREIESSSVSPGRLCFEVTETAAVANLEQAQRFLAALKGVGCRLALDDFGTGLSSFAYLRSLPVDYLKIDGAFVLRMTRDPIHSALVASINHVGHLMGIQTIAESVEDEATLEALRGLHVDYAQGFFVGHPTPLSLSPEG